MRLGGVLAAAFGIAAVLAPSALAAKQPGALFDVQVEGRVDHDWRAGPAAPPCRTNPNGYVASGFVAAPFQRVVPRAVRVYVSKGPSGFRFQAAKPRRNGTRAALAPFELEAFVTAGDTGAAGVAECAGTVDTEGCAQRQTTARARLVGQGTAVRVVVDRLRFVPLRGSCFLGDYADFSAFPGAPSRAGLTVALPGKLLSRPLTQVTADVSATGALTSFDGTSETRRRVTVILRRVRG